MRFATSIAALAAAFLSASGSHANTLEEFLRDAARDNGLVPAAETHVAIDAELARLGKHFFESKSVSLNGQISCRDCHLDKFGSADGIPNAVGVGGQGEGKERVASGGAIIPRNALPFWGRGGVGFNVFFWDGRVDFSGEQPISQFGDVQPSDDPLVVAIHLPPVQIREMIIEDALVSTNKREDARSAAALYGAIVERLLANEADAMHDLAVFLATEPNELSFVHVAEAIAGFIRQEFRLRESRFHDFVFNAAPLTESELRGGMLFYGKGKCAVCHSGPYLSDFDFHAVAFSQLGYGMNGFGIDYGRYNVTHNPQVLYRFRTPPLFNVEKTAPYGHSGSVATLEEAVVYHFDPLRNRDMSGMDALQRHEFYKSIVAAGSDMLQISYLDDEEVADLVAFLKALSF